MTRPVRVACATDSGRFIDGHFGSCKVFAIWDVGRDTLDFVAARSAHLADEEEDRNAARAALIDDCQIACFSSIGGPAAAKVVRAGAHPLKVAPTTDMYDWLAKLQQALDAPPPWLAKVMGVEAASLAPYRAEAPVEE
ncbi:MAG: NifB/NifX family molybdenum-iron cluster-binding protein [Rhodocyclaceae bacterium]|nr:NifB/NifX family molybdenum-iron cluster-binding protein [Rhodocyclaceae bacterium]